MNHAKDWLGFFNDGLTKEDMKPRPILEIDSFPRLRVDSTFVDHDGKVIRAVIDTTWVVREKEVRND